LETFLTIGSMERGDDFRLGIRRDASATVCGETPQLL
jgi:hypothetical protein